MDTPRARRPFPLPSDFEPGASHALMHRALATALVAAAGKDEADDALRRGYPALYRAVVSPTTLAGSSAIAPTDTANFILGLAAPSAAGELIKRGLKISLQGYAQITVPNALVVAADAGQFVGEGSPIGVDSFLISNAALSPKKFGIICTYTAELARHAVRDFETILRQLISEAARLGLDGAIFSPTAASADRPAGILNGVVAQTPTAGGGFTAFSADMKNLAGALATAGDVIIVAAPAQAVAAKNLAGPKFDYPILTSATLATGTVIALDANAFVSGFGPDPEFSTSRESVLHMEADSPLAIGTPGAPAVVASPSRSLFQTDCLATKAVMRTSWAMRAPSVAFVTGTTW